MFEISLSLKKTGTRARLGIPLPIRVLGLVFALATGFATFAFGDIPPLGVALTLVLVFLVLYEESWNFDRRSETCTTRLGLLVLNRQKSWALADLESVTVSRFIKGSQPGTVRPGSGARETSSAGADTESRGNPAPSPVPDHPGFFRRRYRPTITRLCLITRQGETLTMETGSLRIQARLESTGKDLAAWLQVPFRQE